VKKLAVTTTSRAPVDLILRAERVAHRCQLEFVPRRGSLDRLLAEHSLLYVVGRDREKITDGERSLHVDEGLLHAKVASGRAHPLIRAVGEARHVVDCTLGLAGDALHLSATLGARITATEASAPVFCLVESALRWPSERWAAAASRLEIQQSPAVDVLRETSADAVFIAPMFRVPASAAPGYALFREIADHRMLDADTLAAARSAAPRVVVRVEKGDGPPEPGWRSVPGKAVDYWVFDR